jgi:RNA polymerase sigma-70 factor (ECF subfamily)
VTIWPACASLLLKEVFGHLAGSTKPRSPTGARGEDLREWCARTWPAVYKFIYRLVQNREEAEDLTQETYFRAVRKGFPQDEPPHMGYMIAVATNLVRDYWRRQRVRGVLSPLEEAALDMAAQGDDGLAGIVRGLLTELPEEYRQVLDLRIAQGYSRTETAEKMGKSAGAVRGLQYRALLALRELVKQRLREVREI